MFTTFFGLALVAQAATMQPVISTSTNEYARERVIEEFRDLPVMQTVAFCESTLRQFEGTTTEALRGLVEPRDRGLFQINERYHLGDAEKMGIDINTVDGNIAYAKVLYLKYGLSPWSASENCWTDAEKISQVEEISSRLAYSYTGVK